MGGITNKDILLLKYISEGGQLTREEIAENMGASFVNRIESLVESGYLEKISSLQHGESLRWVTTYGITDGGRVALENWRDDKRKACFNRLEGALATIVGGLIIGVILYLIGMN